jgi:hypothetical protein
MAKSPPAEPIEPPVAPPPRPAADAGNWSPGPILDHRELPNAGRPQGAVAGPEPGRMMASSRSFTADAAPAWTPPTPPTLTDAEIAAAVASGGFIGLVKALFVKLDDPRFIELANVTGDATSLVEGYCMGVDGGPHAVHLARLDRYILAVQVHAEALNSVGRYIVAHPGQVVPGDSPGGLRRIF